MIKQKERIIYLDFYKGIGIILMIMGHIGFGDLFDHFIHGFHMPIFFYISGYLYAQKDVEIISIRSYVMRRVKTLVIPYLFWGISLFGVRCFMYEINIEPLRHLFWDNTTGLAFGCSLWFITALLVAEITHLFIDKKVRNEYARGIAILSIVIIGHFVSLQKEMVIPFACKQAFVGVGFIYAGVMTKRKENTELFQRIKALKIWEKVLIGIGISCTIMLNGYVNMRINMYGIIPLFWTNAIVAAICGLYLFQYIEKYIYKFKILEVIKNIGKNSIVYLALNEFMIFIQNEYIYVWKIQNMFEKILIKLVILVGTLMVLYLCSYILNNIKKKIVLKK